MPRQFWAEALDTTIADGTAVANTTTETIIFPNVPIPANYMNFGRTLRINAFGRLSTTGTPTITFKLRWGGVAGTTLATTEAITNGSGVTSVNWSIEAFIQNRSNGATGTLFVMGRARVQTNASGDPTVKSHIFSVSGSDLPAAVTVDLTATSDLALTAQWSAASASNTLTGHIYVIEGLN